MNDIENTASLERRAQALGEAAKEKAQEFKTGAELKAAEIKTVATEKAAEIKTAATEKAQEIKTVATEKACEIKDKAGELHEAGEEYIKENPTKSVLIAAGIGFVLGALICCSAKD